MLVSPDLFHRSGGRAEGAPDPLRDEARTAIKRTVGMVATLVDIDVPIHACYLDAHVHDAAEPHPGRPRLP